MNVICVRMGVGRIAQLVCLQIVGCACCFRVCSDRLFVEIGSDWFVVIVSLVVSRYAVQYAQHNPPTPSHLQHDIPKESLQAPWCQVQPDGRTFCTMCAYYFDDAHAEGGRHKRAIAWAFDRDWYNPDTTIYRRADQIVIVNGLNWGLTLPPPPKVVPPVPQHIAKQPPTVPVAAPPPTDPPPMQQGDVMQMIQDAQRDHISLNTALVEEMIATMASDTVNFRSHLGEQNVQMAVLAKKWTV